MRRFLHIDIGGTTYSIELKGGADIIRFELRDEYQVIQEESMHVREIFTVLPDIERILKYIKEREEIK